jgi:hypothetical protein
MRALEVLRGHLGRFPVAAEALVQPTMPAALEGYLQIAGVAKGGTALRDVEAVAGAAFRRQARIA